jgi:Flp pilus assembly pilin Flp
MEIGSILAMLCDSHSKLCLCAEWGALRISTFDLNTARRFVESESGSSASEYALILAFIAVALVAVLTNVVNAIAGAIGTVANLVSAA